MATAQIWFAYNNGEMPKFADGRRSYLALDSGRKYVTLVDWTTCEHAKVERRVWERLRIEPLPSTKRLQNKVRKTMRHRMELCGLAKTKALKEALRATIAP